MLTNPVASSGTTATINDTAPTADPYNLTICEILAAPPVTVTSIALPRGPSVKGMDGSGDVNEVSSGALGTVCSPGGLATLEGTGLTTQDAQNAISFPLPANLAGVRLKVNGVPAPLLFASDTQVNFQCPQVSPGTALDFVLEAEGGVAVQLPRGVMQPAAPRLFAADPSQQGVVLIANTNEIAMAKTEGIPSRPARPGEYLTIYASGLGEVKDGVTPGTAAPLDRLIFLSNKVSIVIEDLEIEPEFAGLAPGTAGLFQVNLRLPNGVTAGPAVPLYLKVTLPDGGVVESNRVTVAVDDEAEQ
jgi:uncharacterized protein (TIGR03437 family)